MTLPGKYRLVIVEDHLLLRAGLIALLATQPEWEVVGEAGDGHEAVRVVEKQQPDLVLLDLSMPRTNGLEAMKELKRVSEKSRILVVTAHKTEDYVFTALQAGADGYILKDSSAEEFFLAIRTVLNGGRYLAPEITTTVVNGYLGAKERPTFQSTLNELSSREREVLKLIAEGHKSREIAEYLCISPKTVEKHRANLMERLQLHGVSALTTYAIEKGLVSK